MKKTIHINLSGMAFTIEDDAYEKLNGYIKAVETRLGNTDDAKETIDDIESRIAELFAPVVHSSGTAITLKDVDEVISVLGTPDVYEYNPEEVNEKQTGKKPPVVMPKRLFRDPHSRVVAGVCSGLGTYFNIDPIVFRLLFVVGLFYGISIIPYIILWIAIPKALTMEQRMQMYGSDYGLNRARQYTPDSRITYTSSLNNVLKGVGVVVGIIILVVSFLAMVVLTVGVLFTGKLVQFIPNSQWVGALSDMLIGPTSSVPAITGILLFIGIPLLMLFYLGLQLVFNFKNGGKIIGATGLILWLAGIALIIYSGVNIATQFTTVKTVSQTEILESLSGDTLFLKEAKIPEYYKGERIFRSNQLNVWTKNGSLNIEGTPEIEIIENARFLALTVEKTARGKNENNAIQNASGAEYFWAQKGDIIQMDRIFTLSHGTRLREQRVKIIIEVPEGKVLKIDPSINVLVN